MANCKECIHNNVCRNYEPISYSACSDFKDKSQYIELPCKVGDELYCVFSPPHPANPADKGKWFIDKFEVARFHYGVKGLSIEMYGYGTVSVREIGKTVFLTREEAEKALKAREQE